MAATNQFQLTETPAQETASESRVSAKKPSFLARGITHPLRRDKKNDFATATGADLAISGVEQILGTEAADEAGRSGGELPWRREFGSLVHLLRHRNITATYVEMAKFYVMDALSKWSKRARLRSLTVTKKGNATYLDVGLDLVDVTGNVIGTDSATVRVG